MTSETLTGTMQPLSSPEKTEATQRAFLRTVVLFMALVSTHLMYIVGGALGALLLA